MRGLTSLACTIMPAHSDSRIAVMRSSPFDSDKGIKSHIFLLMSCALLFSCSSDEEIDTSALQNFLDREAIEQTLSRANLGFELSDPELFASAFAEDVLSLGKV